MPLARIKENLTYKEHQLDSQPSECQDTMHQLGGMLGNQFCEDCYSEKAIQSVW